MPDETLKDLRKRISKIDDEILSLIEERMSLSVKVGEYKRAHGLPIKDYGVEKQIIDKVRQKAGSFGMAEDLGEDVFKTLIEHSCKVQDDLFKVKKEERPSGSLEILMVGGFGLMGQWFSEYFDSLGHKVTIYDAKKPQGSQDGYRVHASLKEGAKSAQIIVLATPLSQTKSMIEKLIPLKPTGLIVDICSLKSPVIVPLEKAASMGLRVASIHPMFGPGVKTLLGRNIILCKDKKHASLAAIKELFSQSSANLVEIPMKEHDVLMSYILGSAHLLNLVFARVLRKSSFPLKKLLEVSGTTFRQQFLVTSDVVSENKDLYYEIQSQNSETLELINAFKESFDTYYASIAQKDRASFIAEMQKAFDYQKT